VNERANADYQARLAARAQFVNNVKHAKQLFEDAQQHLKDAEKALADYSKKENK
jgi:hypothetical protein